MATQILGRFSYPKVPGDQPWSIIDVAGPASYVEMVPGTPPTGGQAITAQDFGLGAIDFTAVQGSPDGNYSGIIVPLSEIPFVPGEPLSGGDYRAFILAWIDVATGLQVAAGTNLTASSLRLKADGRW